MDTKQSAYFTTLSGMTISNAWRGYGSAIFLEFGVLTPSTMVRRDGSAGSATGEMEGMIEGGWRIEIEGSRLASSQSDGSAIQAALDRIAGLTVAGVELVGSPPELSVELSGGGRVSTFKDDAGISDWTLFDNRALPRRWISVVGGQVAEGCASAS